ncbi:J domain-containing protein [Luteibacter yeojuensis]|uniref:J domain-containing protein n=1 Tax=Luteibacter yeojuensis TaxID=345309 RepID=A0A0F3K4B2_9GAMM|nr:J domain-containing protein [Luteibacter yeojuensis]KJV24939.1 hypothetical protein VI08_20055 [Luteibacter yeojuensis]
MTVADETDFLDLYGKLRLRPDCSLADFKQAYRRHVSQWHPDRRSRGEHADAVAARRLQRLMAQYAAAMDFHKRHGRLPGARAVPGAASVFHCGSALARDDELENAPVLFEPEGQDVAGKPAPTGEQGVPPAVSGMQARKLAWLATFVVAGVLVWTLVPDPDRVDPTAEGVPVVTAEVAGPAVGGAMLAAGMKEDEVIAVEGEPTLRGPDRWQYGPSWVRFEGGSVVDWYSSPLRALHVRDAHSPR